VIYVLADTERKYLYVGEAKNLIKRLTQNYPSIPNWNKFRYDVLPNSLDPFRISIERMMIRSYATIFDNKKDIPNITLSEWKLANDKIDK